MNNALYKIATHKNGFVSSSDADASGVPRVALSRAVDAGELVRIARGLYCTPQTWEDEYLIAVHRFGRGILSHETALYLLDLAEGAPERIAMTFPRGYNTSSAMAAGITPKTVAENLHRLGETKVATPYGNDVRAYDAERALCDMVRGRAAIDTQALNPAMKAYLSSTKRNVPKLLDYARKLGVESKIANYVEVLL